LRAKARVTFPDTRIVWPSIPLRSGSELIEIADSPNPGRYSMLNCPGSNRNRCASSASSNVNAYVEIPGTSRLIPEMRAR
jgi:hypothetical protein